MPSVTIARTWGSDFAAALGLDGFGAGSGETFGVGDSIGNGVVAAIGQIGHEERTGFGASGGADVVLHFGHRHVSGVGVTQNNHPEGVAHENERDAGFVEQPRHGEIIGRERGDFLATSLHGPDGVRRDFTGSR